MGLSYRALHWGKKGERPAERLTVASPRAGDPLERVGELQGVVYRTEKGLDAEPVDYDHDFARPFPLLLRTREGLYVIAGGRYRVEARGIVDNAARADRAFARLGPRARLVLLGDLVECRIVRPCADRAETCHVKRPWPRLCYHAATGLLVLAGGRPGAIRRKRAR